MLRRSVNFLSKAKRISGLPKAQIEASSVLLQSVQKAMFSSSIWTNSTYQYKNLTNVTRYNFASEPTNVKLAMPALSPTMEQGNIIKWHVKEGDKVGPGDNVCDIETDKATLGFEMQDEGYIAKILVGDGTKGVKVGTPIVILVDKQGDVAAFANYKADAPAPTAAKTEAPKQAETPKQPAPQTITKPAESSHEHHSTNFKGNHHRTNVQIRFTHGRANSQARGGSSHGAQSHAQGDRVIASPLARKVAREKGIDLSQVQGSGPNGRILVHDVETFTPRAATETKAEAPKAGAAGQKAVPQQPGATAQGNQYQDIPLTSVREIIAKRLLESKTTIPHYYLKIEVTMDEISAMREKLNKESKSKISFNDIFIKAASLACREVPEVNSQWHGSFIRKYKNADVSVAVDTGSGLITPIVFAANTKGLNEIATTTKALVDKAKTNTLKPQEFQGGTFSISNLGMLGISRFSAVINPPQSCILAVGKTGKKIVPDGESFKEVNVMEVTLSCDHRVVDGAVGARWLQAFKGYLEKPYTMLL